MVSEYSRKKFSPNTTYTVVVDKKFKTNGWKINFIEDISKVDSPALSLAASVLSSCNAEENTMALLNKKLNNLYGANLYSSVSKRGNMFIMTVGIGIIDDKYALENEKLSNEAVDLLLRSIFSPSVVDGGFEKEIFNIEKNDLKDSIHAEINDKRRYLFQKAYAEVFKGEPAANPIYGTIEEAEKITPQSAYKAYESFLKTSIKEIYFEGTTEYPETEKTLRDAFSKLDDCGEKDIFKSEINIKEKKSVITENINVSQSKFLIALKTRSCDKYTMRLFSAILGGIPSSKLFTNVREKKSLCYYCTSSYLVQKNTLIIDCGVDAGKEQAAIDAVYEQLDEMKKGNITQEELNAALLAYDNILKSVGDVAGSYMKWWFDCFCAGEFILPDVSSSRYHAVTVDMLKEAANNLIEDTIYILRSEEKEML